MIFFIDSVFFSEQTHNSTEKLGLEPYFLTIGVLTLIAAVVIPFLQKKYEEKRAKRSFKLYFKKQLGVILLNLISEKIEYVEPSNKENPRKELLNPTRFANQFKTDYNVHKNSIQPLVIFTLLMNFQRMLLYAHRLKYIISQVDFKSLTEQTLAHGSQLSKEELKTTYGLILVLENFQSILFFQDRFGEMKSVKRLFKNKIWIGLKLDNDFLEKQEVVREDFQYLISNEKSIFEITKMIEHVELKLKEYFEIKNGHQRGQQNDEIIKSFLI